CSGPCAAGRERPLAARYLGGRREGGVGGSVVRAGAERGGGGVRPDRAQRAGGTGGHARQDGGGLRAVGRARRVARRRRGLGARAARGVGPLRGRRRRQAEGAAPAVRLLPPLL